MDQEEKVVQAKACKERGTAFLKQEKYQLAVKQYKKIIDLLEYDSGKYYTVLYSNKFDTIQEFPINNEF